MRTVTVHRPWAPSILLPGGVGMRIPGSHLWGAQWQLPLAPVQPHCFSCPLEDPPISSRLLDAGGFAPRRAALAPSPSPIKLLCSAQQRGWLTPATSTTRKHSPCCPMGQGRHEDRDRDSPRHPSSGQGQCPGTRAWVTEGARVWSCSVQPGGMDRWMEGCCTAKPFISCSLRRAKITGK